MDPGVDWRCPGDLGAMRIAAIIEGPTDKVIIECVLVHVLKQDSLAITTLQPQFDALLVKQPGVRAPGWQGVRGFLQSEEFELAQQLFDLVIVHIDASVRKLPDVRNLLLKGEDELDGLCRVVKSWANAAPAANCVIVLPREEIESWLLAAHSHAKRIEQIADPLSRLREVGLVGEGKGKSSVKYRELCRALPSVIDDADQLARIPELERFVGKIRSFRSRHRKQSR